MTSADRNKNALLCAVKPIRKRRSLGARWLQIRPERTPITYDSTSDDDEGTKPVTFASKNSATVLHKNSEQINAPTDGNAETLVKDPIRKRKTVVLRW